MSNELNIGNLPFQYEPTNFYKQSLPPIRNDVSKTKSFQKNERLPISEKVTVKSIAGENPQELQKRLLLEAASRAGLDGTEEQKQFVNRYLTGISFVNAADDPSKNDDTKIKSADLKGEYFNYRLSKDEIESLRELQKSYQQNGGKLHAGKTYDNSTSGRTLTAAEMRSGKHGMTAEQFERWNTQEEYRKAHILPTAFSTPSKLNDLKHVVIDVPADVKADDADGVLRSYIEQRYGGGNLWGDKKADILQLAKQSGVKLENISVSGGKAEFNISVGSLLKLHQAYISVQENFNAAEKIAQTAQDKMALNQFLIGVGEGAWADLKSNYKMVRHPVETINNIREAVSALSNLSKDDLLKIYESLKAQGKSFIFEKDISEVSRDVGKVVGAALVEFALFKGIGAGLKALQGLTTTAGFLQKANQLKQTIGKLPIPTAAIKIVDFGNGLKMPMATGELKKLEDVMATLESRAQQTFSGVKKAINLPAWEKLVFKLDPDGSIHFLSGHKKDGNRLLNSLKNGGNKGVFPEYMSEKQIINTVKDAYQKSKKIKTQTLFGEDKVKLVGESNGLRIEMWVNITTKTLETAYTVK